MTRPTIRSTYKDRPTSVPLSGLTIALIAGALAGLFFLGWWMFEYRINREAEIRRDSFNFQVSAEEQVINLDAELARIDVQIATATDDQAAPLNAQREAIRLDLCSNFARINNPSATTARIAIQENC